MIEFRFVGWMNENSHDKIWGVAHLTSVYEVHRSIEKYLVFWGRRGKTLQSKIIQDSWWAMDRLISGKQKRVIKKLLLSF